MQLENSFTVPVPVDEAWRVLLDIERIGPCMPGAVVDSVTGDDFTGRVKVKLGPINLTYQGKASFIEKDEANRRAVIDARGKDQRGNGTAAAIVTATLAEEGSITRVDVLTDLNITGRPAQFGRGVMTDVGNKLLGQFAEKLAAQLGEGDAQGDAARAEAASAATSDAGPAPTSAAATATGVVEEVAASAEQVPGEGAAAKATRATGAAAKKAAASATDAVTGGSNGTPAKKAPAKKAAAAASSDTVAIDTGSAGTARGAKAPSTPPSGTTAPPTKPATGAPVRSVPSAPPRAVAQGEPEPIDLLEVAGGAAMARFAAPAAGVGAVVLLILLLLRRRRR